MFVRHRQFDVFYFGILFQYSFPYGIKRVLQRFALVRGKFIQQNFADFHAQRIERNVDACPSIGPIRADGCAQQSIVRRR